jgi:hypothetical protein
MTPEIFAEWMRRQGHQVFHTDSSYWYSAGPRVLQAFPYHWQICPSAKEIRDLLMGHGILALRYSAPFDHPCGMVSYHVVLHRPYDLNSLRSQARNAVKRGLNCFKIQPVPFERLATEGWCLQQDTLDRQQRLQSMSREQWERLCLAANGLPGFEAWAALSNGELAAGLMICRIEDVFNVPYAFCHRKHLGNYVNNALFFAVSCEMLGREGVREIFFTVQSLDAPPTVDDFKFRMGLIPQSVRQCVEFHPLLQPFATRRLHRLTQFMLQRNSSNPALAKAEGMLRFHLEGAKSLAEQKWPDCLIPDKDRVLASIVESKVN